MAKTSQLIVVLLIGVLITTAMFAICYFVQEPLGIEARNSLVLEKFSDETEISGKADALPETESLETEIQRKKALQKNLPETEFQEPAHKTGSLESKQGEPAPKVSQESKNPTQLPSEGEFIEIDLSDQKLILHNNGKVAGEYSISSGKPGMSTPTGEFQVLDKLKLIWSKKYSLYMPYSLHFGNDYCIHELPYWPGGYREGENHLGIPVSHGCVRLGVGPAKTVYDFARVGTKIHIHQ